MTWCHAPGLSNRLVRAMLRRYRPTMKCQVEGLDPRVRVVSCSCFVLTPVSDDAHPRNTRSRDHGHPRLARAARASAETDAFPGSAAARAYAAHAASVLPERSSTSPSCR